LKLRPEKRLEVRARAVTQIRGDTRQRGEFGIAQRSGRIAARDDHVDGLVQAIGQSAFSHGHS